VSRPFWMCDASHVGNGFATQARRQELRPAASLARLWRDQNRTKKARGLPAEAIRSALTRWPALSRLLDDGRIELDNNPVERVIRPVALCRKNHLFAGSDGGGDLQVGSNRVCCSSRA
jgi:transposase